MSIVIHDNDRANRETRLRIPCTTLDQLFSFPEGEMTAEDFYVMTKESRDALLGKRGDDETADEKGYLDTAIDYLTDANTLLGAQRMRLEFTYSNLTTQEETTTASESTIRDADMAKEMTSFAKNNVLSQAAQSMLAQANQNASSVLGLLQ
ncbi:MAG: hypothetical protein IKN43_00750 [Selenomonadaceae bacterium]|nr:hypothetical protein [Selenomonadaceae bacterium]